MDTKTKNYNQIDLFKFFAAILIIALHANPFSSYSKPVAFLLRNVLATIAVPFFFTASGFLYFKKQNGEINVCEKKLKRYLRKMSILYIFWSLVYLPFVISDWVTEGFSYVDLLVYTKRFFFIGSYLTIWFLPAVMFATFLVSKLRKRFSYKMIFALSTPFYILACLGSSYYGLLRYLPLLKSAFEIYFVFFETVKNGLFFGFIFVALGALISEQEYEKSIKPARIVWLSIFSFLLLLFETLIQQVLKLSTNGVDTKLSLLPLTYFGFMLLLSKDGLKDNKAYIHMRKLSTLMFLSQRLFLTIYPTLLENSTFTTNSLLYFLLILVSTLFFSEIILWLSKRIKAVKYFY